MSAAALIVVTVVGSAAARLFGVGQMQETTARPLQVLALRFEDQSDGSVSSAALTTAPLSIRSPPRRMASCELTLRGLARERNAPGFGDAMPFRLTHWDDGRMSLDDTTTRRHVALEAFSRTNAGAFARLFSPPEIEVSLLFIHQAAHLKAPCTVEIEHSAGTLEAHVAIDSDSHLGIRATGLGVPNPPTEPPFGKRLVVRCVAMITSGPGLPDGMWTRVAGNFDLTELYDVSFTDRRRL